MTTLEAAITIETVSISDIVDNSPIKTVLVPSSYNLSAIGAEYSIRMLPYILLLPSSCLSSCFPFFPESRIRPEVSA